MEKVHRVWSLSSQRFLELQINTSNTDLAEVKSSKKEGEGNLGKITFTKRSPEKVSYHLVFEEATNDRNYSLEMDDSDNLSVKGWQKGKPPNPPLEFQPDSKNSGPFTKLIALKPSWTKETAKENSFFLASRSDGTLSLRPYHPLDEHHPDELFLLTYV
ncbi:uncharacterized protein [Porites lutea]|uniref:uncharacterized protein n=1 Tax=Porites lutea TaxID=51062 RepID=UPI003CC5F7EF